MQYGNFYDGITGSFHQVHMAHALKPKAETLQEIKLLHEMKTKRGLSADSGLDKPMQDYNKVLQEHISDLMKYFKA